MKPEQKQIMWRIKLVYVVVVLLGVLVFGRVIVLQAFTDREEIEALSKQVVRESIIEPVRGDICARDGRILATSVPYYEVGWDPNCDPITDKVFQENIDSLAISLSKILGKDLSYYHSKLHNARDIGSRYVQLSYSANYDQLKKLKACPIFRKGRFKGGFVYFQRNEREHPFGILAKRTIGTVRQGGRKGVGLEDYFDKDLRGVEGFAVKQKVAGDLWMPINDGKEIEPQDGVDLITCIDIRIQDVAETALESQLRKHNAEHGSVVVMEVQTGDVLAIANLKRTQNDFFYEAYNYAVGEATDPGSTFKLASVIVALEDNVISPDDMIETGRGIHYYFNHRMVDSHEGGFGTINFQEAFVKSSNVGISKVIYENYKDRPEHYVDRLYKLGLNQKLEIAIRGEAEPLIRYPGDPKWSGISLPQMSIGYEVQITPLQTLAFYNAVANNGKKVKPRFARALSYRGDIVNEFPVQVINPSICSHSTIQKVHEMMVGVLLRGTATNLNTTNYQIAGKTGTAQINYGQANKRQHYLSSFVGYFPAEEPKYSCIVTIHDPKQGGYYGNIVAGPVFRAVADKIHAIDPEMKAVDSVAKPELNIPGVKVSDRQKLDAALDVMKIPHDERELRNCQWVYPVNQDDKLMYYIRDYSNKQLVPNVVGMGLSDAIKVLEEFGLVVRVNGRGKVFRQSIKSGQTLKDGDIITIELG
ncbi:MAG: penicillin-binding protein [Bacteroidota bacterium]|nr:penicillin-binding protein [Bacteroidota bacterium]